MKDLYVVVGFCKDTTPFVWGDNKSGNMQIMDKEEAERVCNYQNEAFPDTLYRVTKLTFLD